MTELMNMFSYHFMQRALIVGVLVAMLMLNYELSLMVLCFMPFVVLFTVPNTRLL